MTIGPSGSARPRTTAAIGTPGRSASRPPVATRTGPGASSGRAPSCTDTPSRTTSSTRWSARRAYRSRPGSVAIARRSPPGSSARSTRRTARPPSARVRAASSPAGPAPRTVTSGVRSAAMLTLDVRIAAPTEGSTVHPTRGLRTSRTRHSWLVSTHGRGARPARTFPTRPGSASCARVISTRSAVPASRAACASRGSTTLPASTTAARPSTADRTAAHAAARNPGAVCPSGLVAPTDIADPRTGTTWSTRPATRAATATPSGSVRPAHGASSSTVSRSPTHASGTAARTAVSTSTSSSARSSPYASERWFVSPEQELAQERVLPGVHLDAAAPGVDGRAGARREGLDQRVDLRDGERTRHHPGRRIRNGGRPRGALAARSTATRRDRAPRARACRAARTPRRSPPSRRRRSEPGGVLVGVVVGGHRRDLGDDDARAARRPRAVVLDVAGPERPRRLQVRHVRPEQHP